MSFARKLKRSKEKKSGGSPKDRSGDDIAAFLMDSMEVATLSRTAVRVASDASGRLMGPMDICIPFVHVEAADWLPHLGIQPGSGDRLYAKDGYLSGDPLLVLEVLRVAPFLRAQILGELKEGMRCRPAHQSTAFVVHADGECEFFYYPLAKAASAESTDDMAPEGNTAYE